MFVEDDINVQYLMKKTKLQSLKKIRKLIDEEIRLARNEVNVMDGKHEYY